MLGLTHSAGADFEQSSCPMGPGHKAQLKDPTWWVIRGICSLPACHMRIHPGGKCQKMSQEEGSFLCFLAGRQPLEGARVRPKPLPAKPHLADGTTELVACEEAALG